MFGGNRDTPPKSDGDLEIPEGLTDQQIIGLLTNHVNELNQRMRDLELNKPDVNKKITAGARITGMA